jgi:molybdenum-dependent DNA-binding transcriptional regulator ModE
MLPFTLQQLRILKAIATEQSFTKAAKLLYLSQPTLSKQIRILEENLDMILINRENHKISFTENGQVFLQYAERILALCEESCRALIDLKNGERGNLIVGASQTIGTYLLPRVLALFAQRYPQIDSFVPFINIFNYPLIKTKISISTDLKIIKESLYILDKLSSFSLTRTTYLVIRGGYSELLD